MDGNYIKEYECTVTLPARIGDTLWGVSDFWGLVPYTVDAPFHCVIGSKNDGAYESRYFKTKDIGVTLFYTKEDYEKATQKSVDIFNMLSKPEKAIGRIYGIVVAACEEWIEDTSYTCSYRRAEKKLAKLLGLSNKKCKKLLNCELDISPSELMLLGDKVNAKFNKDELEKLLNEIK